MYPEEQGQNFFQVISMRELSKYRIDRFLIYYIMTNHFSKTSIIYVSSINVEVFLFFYSH